MALPKRAQRVLRTLRQAIPSGVVLGRRSPGDGPAEYIDLDEIQQAQLDAISTTRGAVLYRGASDWEALAPGTSGQFLQTKGTGADPVWASGGAGGGGGAWEYISAHTPSAGVIAVSLPGDGGVYKIIGDGITFDTDSVELRARLTVSGTPVSANSSYKHSTFRHFASSSGVSGGTTAATEAYMALGISNQGNAGFEETSFDINIYGADVDTRYTSLIGNVMEINEFSADLTVMHFGGLRRNGEINDSVRFYAESGNIDGGTIRLYKHVTS